MPKFVSIEEAVKLIPDGATVMFGGFMGCGSAHKFIDALSKSGVKDLTMICNDASMPGGPMGEDYYATAKLVHNKQIKRLIATHVGLNPEVATQSMIDGTLEVVLIPQGSLAEMIRADGAGLGGVLTPTGVGTIVEDNPYCLGKRVHLSQIGYPIVGDFVYSNGKNPFGVEGQMLHSSKLDFVHPTTGEKMHLEAKLPEYFEEVLNKLKS